MGGQGRFRSADLPLFRRTLFRLSYLTSQGATSVADVPGRTEDPGRSPWRYVRRFPLAASRDRYAL
jgi:hypothetical protein